MNKNKVIIVVPDRTRNAHLREILPVVLKNLEQQATCRQDIEILIGLGLHEPMNKTQLIEMLGPTILDDYTVYNHSQQPAGLAYLGKTSLGVPRYLNKKLLSARKIITLGIVEPHLYAGYSGGIKTVAIGLAGDKTISYTHHPRFLDNKGTALGNVKTNLFQKTLVEIVKDLPITHSVNIVNNSHGKRLKIFSGKPAEVFKQAVTFADHLYRQHLPRIYDAAIAVIDKQKGANIYQASRAYNYLLNVPRPIVKPGGYVIVIADVPEGFGRGLGEQRFGKMLKKVKNLDHFIEQIKKGGCQAGEHRAYMVAKAIKKANLLFVSAQAPKLLHGTPIQGFSTTKEALAYIARDLARKPRVFKTDEVFNAIYSADMVK
ncbi:MAG: lactate racemase domain-containing protein [bacterium]|nr:lactate racemase domain-containing protein [bacterium]MDD5353781.1 lactate racemase domain-containing protein [bacterium]MDD5757183.1 lactate racemase domain-containing protein [bacterium]